MKYPLISILVPVYGVEKFIERCAVSLFEQTYPNIEYVFVDDCGKDNSIQILKEVASRYSDRIGYVSIIRHEKNRGLAAARNTAVAAAHGEFVIHVDSDDFLDLTAIERLYKKQVENDYDIVSCDFTVVGLNGESFIPTKDYQSNSDYVKAILRVEENTNIVNRLIRLSIYRDHNIKLDEESNVSEDFQTTPRVFYYAQKVAFLHEGLYKYSRENEGSLTYKFNVLLFNADVECRELINFFKDKEPDYMEAINFGITNRLVKCLVFLSVFSGYDDLYNEVLLRLQSRDRSYLDQLSTKMRIAAKLSNKRRLLSIYIKTGLLLNKMKRKFVGMK